MIDTHTLTRFLDQPAEAFSWFQKMGFSDPEQAHRNLLELAQASVPLDLLVGLCSRLETVLVRLADPDMVFTNLTRFLLANRSPLSLATLLDRAEQDMTNFLPGLAILASQHETQYSRLFRS